MRVGILTFPNSPSFGATLQMCGLYHALEELGCDTEIINYRNTFMSKKKHIPYHTRNKLKKMIIFLLDVFSKKKFHRFEKQMKFYPKCIISEMDNLKSIAQRYDYLICGSDQVWNPLITGEDLNYFFAFCADDCKKISYAASFGVNNLSEPFATKVKEQLKTFKYISVREEQGAEIVKGLLGKECSTVLDPSMLISQDSWRTYEKKINGLPSKYIAKFIFNHDVNVERKILELSQRTNLPIVTIGGSIISKFKKELFTGPIGPNEWLYVLDNAEYVVTDSFHGAAFSIIFHKQVYVSLASSTNSRLKTLLHTFGLDDRVICSDVSEDEIDYCHVQETMDERKKYSLGYLKQSISNGE